MLSYCAIIKQLKYLHRHYGYYVSYYVMYVRPFIQKFWWWTVFPIFTFPCKRKHFLHDNFFGLHHHPFSQKIATAGDLAPPSIATLTGPVHLSLLNKRYTGPEIEKNERQKEGEENLLKFLKLSPGHWPNLCSCIIPYYLGFMQHLFFFHPRPLLIILVFPFPF